MTTFQTLKLPALGLANDFALHTKTGKTVLQQPFSKDPDLLSHIHRRVHKLRMQGYGKVGRKGPGRGSPDNHIGSLFHTPKLRYGLGKTILTGKLHIHGKGSVIGVLNLRLCQSSDTVDTPVNGL